MDDQQNNLNPSGQQTPEHRDSWYQQYPGQQQNTGYTQQPGNPQSTVQPHSPAQPQSTGYPYSPGQQPRQPTGTPALLHPQRPKRRFRNAMKTALTTVSLIRGILAIFLIFFLIILVSSAFTTPDLNNTPIKDSFFVIKIEGTIAGERAFGETGYDHQGTVSYIASLIYNSYDKGILLYMDTPGGTVYHSDELYLALLDYKAKTGRPVYAYMAETCASGGYYISMAADYLFANRITVTGSIGVFSTLLDTSELFDKLGVRTILVDTGEHKGVGTMGIEITPAQAAVMQSMIDEYYDLFVDLIADGRNMDNTTVRGLADGRIYTARQALELGLIDEICTWEKALLDFEGITGAEAHYPYLIIETPLFGQILARISGDFPSTEADIALGGIDALPCGVPLAIAPELMR